MWLVYILRLNNNSLYTGITNDLEKRLAVHAMGKGSKYVRAFKPFELVYKEEVSNKSIALIRESEIKKWPAMKKWALVKGDIK